MSIDYARAVRLLSLTCPAGLVLCPLQAWSAPALTGQKRLRRPRGRQHFEVAAFYCALRALVLSGLARALARPPYGEVTASLSVQ